MVVPLVGSQKAFSTSWYCNRRSSASLTQNFVFTVNIKKKSDLSIFNDSHSPFLQRATLHYFVTKHVSVHDTSSSHTHTTLYISRSGKTFRLFTAITSSSVLRNIQEVRKEISSFTTLFIGTY
jgi:hypothetical protein